MFNLSEFLKKSICTNGKSEFFESEFLTETSHIKNFGANPVSRKSFLKSLGIAPFFFFFANEADALAVKGINYVSISQAANRLGMKYQTLELKKKQRIFSKNISLIFDVNRRDMTLNGQKIWMGAPVVEANNMLYISSIDLEKTLLPILYPHTVKNPPSMGFIILDAGHGGKDKGAINKTLFEKNLALDITIRTAKCLRTLGFKVALTRNDDTFLELPTRPAIANANKADFFASIHINSASPSANGVETYALTPSGLPSTSSANFTLSDNRVLAGNKNDEWNLIAAYYVQKQLASSTKALDRGVKRARFAVLQTPNMPSILVECGFISSPSESAKLATAEYRQTIASGISTGLANYAAMLKRIKGAKK